MFRRLLVPLDGSKVAETVFPYVEEITTKCGAEIILVSVSESTAVDTGQLCRSYLEQIAEQVEHRFSDWGATKEARVTSQVLVGKPANEILRYADEHSVDLIALSSHGAGKGPWAMGNIAWKVLQIAEKPVLLIRAPADSAALEQKRLLKKILVPLDGSEIGGAVISHIEVLAQALGAEVILFHVLEVPSVGVLAPGIEIAYRTSTLESEKKIHLAYLDNVEKRLKEMGLSTSSVLNIGFAADEIIKYSENNAVDLIAMSTHGRSGIGRWVLGSVTQKVLHTGNTPVLTVRAKKA
jgi:nucleotide-binding universal stress UspA family protein